MNLKLTKILKILFLINLTSNISTAIIINCLFNYIRIPLSQSNIIQGYGCDINNVTAEDLQNPLKFIGIHNYVKTDDDVTIIRYQVYEEHQPLQFDSSFCEKFPNIETIFISELEILSVDQNSLENCKKLSKIFVCGNKIRELPENLLDKNLNLTVLNLDFNFLDELAEDFLKNQKALEELSLTNNLLSTFSSNFFESLTNLNILHLGSNKISTIEPEWFTNLQNLASLGLERNEITVVPSGIFSSIRYLVELNLSHNKIKILTSHSFSGLHGLKSLNLDHNKIEELPENLFSDAENLEEISIGHNKLSVIHSTSFGSLQKLTSLHLHFNDIEAFDERLIDNTAVHDLDLTKTNCSGSWVLNRDEMKEQLRQCFENYLLLERARFVVVETESTPATISTTSTTEQAKTTTSIDTNIGKSGNLEGINILINSACGKPKLGIQTTIGGKAVAKGSFPWNAAIFASSEAKKSSYICGGSVVSKRAIVTAAHCFEGKRGSHIFTAKNIIVSVGNHDLSKSLEVGRQTMAVRKIISHTDWNPNILSFDADIAILVLDEDLAFTHHVQPICLISPGTDMEYITKGFVAGYGKSEFSDVEGVARVLEMPIYSYKNCSSSPDHVSLLSHRTFCAGYANGSGVCVGDSGSGFHVVHRNTYYLRGIVSASLNGVLYGCNVNAYSVFTDAIKLYDYIKNVTNQII